MVHAPSNPASTNNTIEQQIYFDSKYITLSITLYYQNGVIQFNQ